MPHGVFLLATPKNANIYYLLSEQPSNHNSHATSCALIPFSNFCTSTEFTFTESTSLGKPSENSSTSFYARIRLLARNNINTSSTPHQRCQHSSRVLYLSPRQEGSNAFSGTSSCLHSWCTSHDLRSIAKSLQVAGNPHHEQIQCSLMHITQSWGLEEFYCRNKFLASNNTATASAPHQRCQHLLKGALLTRQQHNGVATLLAILLVAIRDALLMTFIPLPGSLASVFSSWSLIYFLQEQGLTSKFTL